ncbi:MAG: rhomboid family intramembrane serine protease [Desulfobulbaceae bacterium]|uniref:Rhomboid family intramembrane serine protease n=1 Tax=Candidatus Desulfobia pelagia TaxID=2841692 RepID=A0A8J6TCJ0_9BACT|nr:rhomboid family intramembrane serine protease [Candidatus Desulfobia pelagia]
MIAQQSKNSLLCPNCRRLISRDESQCPYCGIRKPSSWWKNNSFIRGLSDKDTILSIILYTNIGFFILSLVLVPRSSGPALNPLTFLSPSNKSLLLLGSTGTVAILELHRWWSLVSANYLHGGILHILFNMMVLRQIGPLVIREYGSQRMIAIYTLGGVAGFALSFLAGVRFTIGASAAVCSLIGAILYYGKSRGGVYGQNLYSQIGGWAVSIFVFGFIVPGINNWGHGGGMAAGALLGYLLGYQEKKRENISHKLLGTSCIIVTAVVLAWAALSSVFYVFVM